MPKDRRHSAIMFTDIAGYTHMMGSDEDKAFEVLSKNREIHSKLVEQFNGTLIKEMGDGMLISFNLASDAVYCAIEIQRKCKEQDIPLKIGIHEGEMVFEGADVLGDAVNVASRLESDTHEGCIYISGSVYRDIKNRTDIKTKFIKDKRFKNVDEPIKVYEVLCDGDEAQQKKSNDVTRAKGLNSKRPYFLLSGTVVLFIALLLIWKFVPFNRTDDVEKSIAVLPLKYLSDDPGKQYLADGVMDAITGHLSKIESLIVRPRTSVEQYRDTHKTSKVIGEELGVSYLIEGSFLMIGNQVKLTIQLINAKDEEHLYFDEYDRDYSDIMSVQSEVAQIIAKEIEVVITPKTQEIIEVNPTLDLTAYDYYLRGKDYSIRSNNQDDINYAINMYKKAVQIDSNFTLAWVGLANCYTTMLYYGANKDSVTSKVENYLNRAKKIDSNLMEVRREEGMYYYLFKQNYTKAYEILAGVYEDFPNDDETVVKIGNCLRMKGELNNSINYLLRAVSINPRSFNHWNELAITYVMLKNYIKAENCYLKSLELNPTNQSTYDLILNLYGITGNFEKANQFISNNAVQFNNPEAQNAKFFISIIYLFQNEFEKSVAILNTIPDEFKDITIPFFKYYQLGYNYYVVSDRQKAYDNFTLAKQYFEEYLQRTNLLYLDIFYAEVLAGLGLQDSAFTVINEVSDKIDYKNNFTNSYHIEIRYINILVMVGNYEKAIKRLSNLISKDGRISVEVLKLDPFWNPLREMDGFKAIINNSEYQVNLSGN